MYPFFYIGEYGPFFAYGLLGGVTLAVFLLRIYFLAKEFGLNAEQLLVIAALAFFVGLLGARLLDLLATSGTPFYSADWNGGYAWYGGPLLVIPYLLLAFWWARIPIWSGLDLFFTTLPLAHAFGRIGCFLAGCCYGKPTDTALGVIFPPDAFGAPAGIPLHPTQLYEAVGLLVIFCILTFISQFKNFSGISFAGYFILYGLLRFVVENFRGDNVERGFVHLSSYDLSVSQFIAMISVLIGAYIFVIRIRSYRLERG